ncbi:hypothetical protein BCR43DRAFT_242641 [Syncephalastrum racemosum]|uniref:Uncharacterized protein n=1 Tax=Syncephalastrum racemosum TaxID=13706 RepID=A0A1X2HEZ1_SYNRA|nr:hypothetical protein BCR43DRAFT_242641 [Syncephalastrum racemosum]
MDAPSADDLDSRDLCEVVRTPVIAARSYRRNVYYDLHAIEVIAGRWIDLMCSPRNHIALTCSERTSALDGALLLLQNLFTRFNDRISFKWIEVEAGATKRHKRDVTLSEVDGDGDKATVMLVEFADGFGKFDAAKLKRDTGKIYRNAAWISQRTYRYSEENRYTLSAKYGLYLPTSHGPPPEIRSPSGPLVAFHSCQKRCC